MWRKRSKSLSKYRMQLPLHQTMTITMTQSLYLSCWNLHNPRSLLSSSSTVLRFRHLWPKLSQIWLIWLQDMPLKISRSLETTNNKVSQPFKLYWPLRLLLSQARLWLRLPAPWLRMIPLWATCQDLRLTDQSTQKERKVNILTFCGQSPTLVPSWSCSHSQHWIKRRTITWLRSLSRRLAFRRLWETCLFSVWCLGWS